jgi:5-methylcytosine-specific restriction endonuclease McrA
LRENFNMSQDNFYESDDWIRLRYQALKRAGGICQCCGDTPAKDNPLQVDHIKSRSRYPYLALDITNLQVLCKRCNIGKGAGDRTDWRSARKRYIPPQNSKWTPFKKAMACCEFVKDNGLGPDPKWYVNNIMLPLIGMTRADAN